MRLEEGAALISFQVQCQEDSCVMHKDILLMAALRPREEERSGWDLFFNIYFPKINISVVASHGVRRLRSDKVVEPPSTQTLPLPDLDSDHYLLKKEILAV